MSDPLSAPAGGARPPEGPRAAPPSEPAILPDWIEEKLRFIDKCAPNVSDEARELATELWALRAPPRAEGSRAEPGSGETADLKRTADAMREYGRTNLADAYTAEAMRDAAASTPGSGETRDEPSAEDLLPQADEAVTDGR